MKWYIKVIRIILFGIAIGIPLIIVDLGKNLILLFIKIYCIL